MGITLHQRTLSGPFLIILVPYVTSLLPLPCEGESRQTPSTNLREAPPAYCCHSASNCAGPSMCLRQPPSSPPAGAGVALEGEGLCAKAAHITHNAMYIFYHNLGSTPGGSPSHRGKQGSERASGVPKVTQLEMAELELDLRSARAAFCAGFL